MVRPDGPRDPIAGPDTVEPPFPLRLRGPVIKGFGRGSKELGIPTANIPLSGLSIGGNDSLASGIYYGFASLDLSTIPSSSSPLPSTSSNHAVADLEPPPSLPPSRPASPSSTPAKVYPTVLSIGYNPYYKNTTRSIEIHILHTFDRDFYGATLSLVILGFIRPEYDYVSAEALVEDIREDIRVAGRSLGREAYGVFRGDRWLLGEKGEEAEEKAGEGRAGGEGQTGGRGVAEMMR
ncbi:riboflavin kinase [Aaosphaeria arxii CBS 175.79]|uniref:Riboflavin kinase n=1 Tax=Aaosphaeria arxii CBS 175.79 TaxID=1450172 RepID=A0A6A5X9I4_9PLEO|nr:riboflavin kinase [Aaosphaeria arxii CBS 175.79]KAF2009628.1 riboflavin kinase [Aaosphaeria arxii CBS 175.79]